MQGEVILYSAAPSWREKQETRLSQEENMVDIPIWPAASAQELVLILSAAVMRSQCIFLIGGWEKEDGQEIHTVLSKALNLPMDETSCRLQGEEQAANCKGGILRKGEQVICLAADAGEALLLCASLFPLDEGEETVEEPLNGQAAPQKKHRRVWPMLTACAAIVLGVGFGWWKWNGGGFFTSAMATVESSSGSVGSTVFFDLEEFKSLLQYWEQVSSSAISSDSSSQEVSSKEKTSSLADSGEVLFSSAAIPFSSAASSAQPVTSKPAATSALSSADTSSQPVVTSPAPVSSSPPVGSTLKVTNSFTGEAIEGDAAVILSRIVEAEMGNLYQPEALKAQAVASYTYILYQQSRGVAAPSMPMKTTASAKSLAAVNSVLGTKALYNGKPANAMYFAISAGKTAACHEIFGGARIPYLVSVDSSVDEQVGGFLQTRRYSSAAVASVIQKVCGVDVTGITDKEEWIYVGAYDESGLYPKSVVIGGKNYAGTYVMTNLFTSGNMGSGNGVRSFGYSIAYQQDTDEFVVEVKGFGHGVGMSQAGANEYAKQGKTYEWILQHYYPGIILVK